MLSKRNLVTMMIMNLVVLVLFLFSVVLKEYFNDYDVNHSIQGKSIEKQETEAVSDSKTEETQVVFVGDKENGYYDGIEEWAGYRKKSFQGVDSLKAVHKMLKAEEKQKPELLLIDGKLLEKKTESETEKLTEYVQQGGVVIFYRLPSYQVIEECKQLKYLLGIQQLRGASVKLHEIRIYSGFLLGGETCYSFEGVKEPDLVDLDREVPWYDISSRTKSYMVGFLSEEEKTSMELHNEDMPALVWRSNLGTGSVFAVNGDYMEGETSMGFLDAMLYETEKYALYPVVNAQNLFFAGFPDLTTENEERLAQVYGMTNRQFCRDVLWPSFVAMAQKGNWKITSFLAVKQEDSSTGEPEQKDLIDYLKYFNEESAEAGISLGNKNSRNLQTSVAEAEKTVKNWNLKYQFAGGYVRKENKEALPTLFVGDGKMKEFQDICTVVGEYEKNQQVLSWLTDDVTLQNATTDAYRHSYKDSLWLKSLETSLGYSNIQADIYRVLWPEDRADEWEKVAEKLSENIDTYWKPYEVFEKTTTSQSDARVRNFLNGSIEEQRDGDRIQIQKRGYTGDAWLLLRTHGEKPVEMNGGTWTEIEKDAYLLQITEETAAVTLEPELESYYTK